MPAGTLPITGYLGDGQRTTGEFQDGVDELLAYVKSLKAEVDALSATVIKEAAVRAVGAAAGNVPDTAVLDTRLGTASNLNLAPDVESGAFDPGSPTLVWSGSDTSVAMTALSEQGGGFYLLQTNQNNIYSIHLRDGGTVSYGSARVDANTTSNLKAYTTYYNGGSFFLPVAEVTSSVTTYQTITAIYKV